MRLALIQLAYDDDESVADRVTRVSDLVRSCADADLVVLPELWAPTGFDYRSWEERAEPVDGPVATAMSELAREVGVTLHAGSIVERLPEPGVEGRRLANTSLVFDPHGRRIATYRKIHRFGFGTGEPALMEAGAEVVVVDVGGIPTGLSTCYDLRFPELYRAQLDAGAELFVVPAAWPAPRVGAWSLLGRARAVENQCFLLACNTAGTHAGTQMGGHSQVVAPTGEVLAEAGEGEELLRLEIDPAQVASFRAAFPVLADRRLGRVEDPAPVPPSVADATDASDASDADARAEARRARLVAALDTLSDADRADADRVARVLVAPGFRTDPPASSEALAADRAARAEVMREVLGAFPLLLGTGAECAADELTRSRPALVHPMTGESLSLLDWVLRGGTAAQALEVLATR